MQEIPWGKETLGALDTPLNELEKKVGDINMDFFPRFNDKKRLDKLTIKFSHQGWAPWNKELFSDKLIIKVLDLSLIHI